MRRDSLRLIVARAATVLIRLGAREVYVFGSAASGSLRGSSDLDLAVSGLPPEVFYRAVAEAASVAGREVDLIDLDEPSLFVRYLRRKGKLRRVA